MCACFRTGVSAFQVLARYDQVYTQHDSSHANFFSCPCSLWYCPQPFILHLMLFSNMSVPVTIPKLPVYLPSAPNDIPSVRDHIPSAPDNILFVPVYFMSAPNKISFASVVIASVHSSIPFVQA